MARNNFLAALETRGSMPAFAQMSGILQGQRQAKQRNMLAEMEMAREQQFNALASDPSTTPEQFARFGRSDIGNSIENLRRGSAQQEESQRRQEAEQRVFRAQYALRSESPAVRAAAQREIEQWGPIAGIGPAAPAKADSYTLNPGEVRFENGREVARVAPRPERASQQAQYRAMTPQELQQAGLPPGTSAQIDLGSGKIDILNKREGLSAAEQKTIREAKMRMPRLDAAIRRVDRLGKAVETLSKGTFADGGPLDAKFLKYTKDGQEVNAAAAQLMPELQALTRVPGIGSQSDLEARLASLALPSLEMAPEVNARSQAELAAFIEDLKAAYASILEGGQPPAAVQQSGGWAIEEVR